MQIMEASFPLLSLMVGLPTLVALLLWGVRAMHPYARVIGLSTVSLELLLAVYLAVAFNYASAGSYQWAETYSWMPVVGVSWALGINAMGLAMIVLSVFLTLVVLIASARQLHIGEKAYVDTVRKLAALQSEADSDDEEPAEVAAAYDQPGYVALTLVSLAFMVLIFSARDLFLFYLTFEAMLIPVYFLIGRYGIGEKTKQAAMKFLLYSLAGGLVMLIGVVAVWAYSPLRFTDKAAGLFLVENLQNVLGAHPHVQMWVFVSFFIAFAVKAPMVPLHTWLADATANARPGTSALLVGILDKIGTFGMISLCLPLFPGASKRAALTIMILAVVSVLWGAFAALAQRDLLRLISFTSVSHFGLMVLAIFSGSTVAMTGAMVYMIAHGLSIAGLFLFGGALVERGGSAKIAEYGGMQQVTPILAAAFLISGLAAIALPGLSGFVPEVMVFMGTFKVAKWAAVCCLVGVVIGAVYVLLPYQRIFTGKVNPKRAQLKDLSLTERWGVFAPLLVVMLVIGLYPAPLVSSLNQVSETLVQSSQSVQTVEGVNK